MIISNSSGITILIFSSVVAAVHHSLLVLPQNMKARFEELVESYITNKVGIDNSFLSVLLTKGLQENIEQLNREGTMIHAGTGNAAVRAEQNFRSDKISWLDKKTGNSSELEFLDQVDEFIGYLNQTCYAGINSYEFHYALYEEGSSYKKHKDQFNNNTNRKYSLVSYLNDDWLAAEGGQLLIYQDELPQAISPNARKAVFFKSDEMEHEVTIASRPRMSITGWLKRI